MSVRQNYYDFFPKNVQNDFQKYSKFVIFSILLKFFKFNLIIEITEISVNSLLGSAYKKNGIEKAGSLLW